MVSIHGFVHGLVLVIRFIIDAFIWLLHALFKTIIFMLTWGLPFILLGWYARYLYIRFEDDIRKAWKGFTRTQKIVFVITFIPNMTLTLIRSRRRK